MPARHPPGTISPWLLTQDQADAMDALAATGGTTLVARRFGQTYKIAHHAITAARVKMSAPTQLRAAVLWDRWRRQGEAVAAVRENT